MIKDDCFACEIIKQSGHEYLHCKILIGKENCDFCNSYKTWYDIYRQEKDVIIPRLNRVCPAYEYKSAIPKRIREAFEEWENEHKNNNN